jgi:hypothetical protein
VVVAVVASVDDHVHDDVDDAMLVEKPAGPPPQRRQDENPNPIIAPMEAIVARFLGVFVVPIVDKSLVPIDYYYSHCLLLFCCCCCCCYRWKKKEEKKVVWKKWRCCDSPF